MAKIRKIPPKSEYRDALILNKLTFDDYLERMKKIALSMFVWVNLPPSMNARYLELSLFYKGQAALLYDDNYGFINTKAADAGYMNIYGLPTKINCYSYKYNETRDLYVSGSNAKKSEECILVMNNYDRTPTNSSLCLFATRLAEAQRTADINIKAQRTPILIPTDQKQYFSLKKMYEEYDGNTPAIFPDKNLIGPEALKAIETGAPFIANDILNYKREIWNEFLSFLGISNLSEKKERLIKSETDSNNELINLNMQALLIPRREACEQFNAKFGTNINVKLRSDLYNIIKENESIVSDYETNVKPTEEGENNG